MYRILVEDTKSSRDLVSILTCSSYSIEFCSTDSILSKAGNYDAVCVVDDDSMRSKLLALDTLVLCICSSAEDKLNALFNGYTETISVQQLKSTEYITSLKNKLKRLCIISRYRSKQKEA